MEVAEGRRRGDARGHVFRSGATGVIDGSAPRAIGTVVSTGPSGDGGERTARGILGPCSRETNVSAGSARRSANESAQRKCRADAEALRNKNPRPKASARRSVALIAMAAP
jgi:hypothetical protein